MTAGLPNHIHITEREPDGTWEDCTWCAGLEWLRDCFRPSLPATHAEAEALRAASGKGPTGGSNMSDFIRGVSARYKLALPAPINAHGIVDALKPGMAAMVQGSMAAFGPLDSLSKWDPKFDGGHAVYVANVGGSLYWCDPEAPTGAAVPVKISSANLQRFVNAFAGEAILAPVLQPAPVKEDLMLPLTSTLIGSKFVIKPGSNIRVEPKIASTKVRTTTVTETVSGGVGTVVGDVDPANGSNVWYGWIEGGEWRFTAKDNVTSVQPPATVPSYPDVRQELADTKAKLLSDEATIDALKPKAAQLDALVAALKPILG